ncbi:SAF domain-containing protein [Sulfurimonas marina]|uniref:SAF domain-containing protein n=1 Tax=Sulfurimonas marina TaxID=2590551 RepID=A0A7M1AY01_9BACT|nr:SAF domain-containing protein [Sulfurimonas marina]QOP42206.1 hypothetical protein FJR03_10845 [Sulfurimonas marina]
MKNKQMRMVVLILIGLVLFTTSLALLMYSKQSALENQVNKVKFVEIFVTTRDIQKGELLSANTIKKAKLPQEYLVGMPLTASEIIGRYAVVDIFKNEPIREQKIALVKPQEQNSSVVIKSKVQQEKPELKDEVFDTVSIPISVFKNIDTSLRKGDKIDIVSVENTQKGREIDFKTKYIALNITIDSFVANGKMTNSYLSSYVEGKPVFAQNIILEISPKDIKNFLMLYYKTQALNGNRVYNTKGNSGHLWIVKCSKVQDEDIQKKKEKMLADYVATVKQRRAIKRLDEASISYEQ